MPSPLGEEHWKEQLARYKMILFLREYGDSSVSEIWEKGISLNDSVVRIFFFFFDYREDFSIIMVYYWLRRLKVWGGIRNWNLWWFYLLFNIIFIWELKREKERVSRFLISDLGLDCVIYSSLNLIITLHHFVYFIKVSCYSYITIYDTILKS